MKKAECGSFSVYCFLLPSPQKGPRCLHSRWKQKAFLQSAVNQNWLFKHTFHTPSPPPSPALQHSTPFPTSMIILDLGRRKAAKSEMCREATGWGARISKHKPRQEQQARVCTSRLRMPQSLSSLFLISALEAAFHILKCWLYCH